MPSQKEIKVKLGVVIKEKLSAEALRLKKDEESVALFFLENRFKLPIFLNPRFK